MSQEQFAPKLGISRSYLSKVEGNTRDVDLALLERMARELGCQPVDLLIRDPKDPEGIWGLWDGMSDHTKAQFVKIGKTLAEDDTDET